ncbi:MAG: 3'-5' exonuclease [Campylobacteraceae bacterium]|nr:3'-5' exonuclease [Campylobacteraceae bacterium]
MLRKVKNYFNKKNLKDQNYSYLFDENETDEYICFDCETTGLNPKVDDIISIAAVLIKDNKIVSSKKFERFVKPKKNLDENSIKIHHIRECDVQNAENIDEVIRDFINFVGNKKLVGYYLEFDIKMVNKYLKDIIGINLPNKTYEVSAIYHDYKIEKIPQSNVDLRFNTILDDLKIPNFGKHDALNDTIMTSLIFLKLKNMHKVKI